MHSKTKTKNYEENRFNAEYNQSDKNSNRINYCNRNGINYCNGNGKLSKENALAPAPASQLPVNAAKKVSHISYGYNGEASENENMTYDAGYKRSY